MNMYFKHISIKILFFYLKNFILKSILDFISWCYCRHADYLADMNNHFYHVFRIGWHFRTLNVKEVDQRKIDDIKYAKRILKLPAAKIHYTIDFQKHCIYTARPKNQ